jgi:putative membrane protein
MKGIVIGIAGAVAAFIVATLLLPKVKLDGDVIHLLELVFVFAVVNAFLKPILKLLAFPINFMTMGAFTFVINTGLLLGVAWISGTFLKLGFTIAGFPKDGISIDAIVMAFLASLIISAVTTAIGLVVKD